MSCIHAKTVPFSDCGKCDQCGEEGLCDQCRYGDLDADPKDYDSPRTAPNYKGPLHECPETILVCTHCIKGGHHIPLIWTFAFNGYEYWCPMCGDSQGMLGAGERMIFSEKLYHRRLLYERYTKAYLSAHSSLICAKLYWDGELIKPSELPKTEIARLQSICENGWKPGLVLL